MEAWGLGLFMLVAGLCVTLLEVAHSPLRQWLTDAGLRRALIGLAMGLTAMGIIYSPWGRRSGAHINPAVTLTFLSLGKIARWDALFYVLAQFSGGTAGLLLTVWILGDRFIAPPVSHIVTLPGPAGIGPAFAAEFVISTTLMLTVLWFMNNARLSRYTGVAAGILVAVFITVEAPLSGMSMNPARTFAAAVPGGPWTGAWLYFIAPVLGMFTAVTGYRGFRGETWRMCAKLDHPANRPCIHCGQGLPESQGGRR